MKYHIINKDNIIALKDYPDNYFDSVVTDPPYGLGREPDAVQLMKDWVQKEYYEIKGTGFMGKEWDAFVPQPLFWKEVFRVLKPGGHCLAFYGTRTYDWGVMAMRFAGFEIRDCIQWLYGSGFPKSHNIGKAIDKMQNRTNEDEIEFVKWLKEKNNLSMQEIDNILGTKSQAFHYFALSDSNRQIPSNQNYKILKEVLSLDDTYDLFIENKNKELKDIREIKGYEKSIKTWNIAYKKPILGEPINADAKQWEGWGSALKPANEPIVLARKPLEKGLSIAENVLKWGTGGINIDGCRIGYSKDDHVMKYKGYQNGTYKSEYQEGTSYKHGNQVQINPSGRFPANIILTHHLECECKETIEDWNCHPDCPIKILDGQSGNVGGDTRESKPTYDKSIWGNAKSIESKSLYNDKGGASRFFYVAKASKSERNKGLEGFNKKQTVGGGGGIGNYLEDVNSASGKYGSEKAPNKNFHPTVKPVKLMQYLARLITPPKGKVLDPFCGSGTTGVACKIEGFEFVGIEQDTEYCKIAEARIKSTKQDINLFNCV